MDNKSDDHHAVLVSCVECARIELMKKLAQTKQPKSLWDLRKETHLEPKQVVKQ
jgi:hypothetical protein